MSNEPLLSEEDAEQLIGAICFKTGPPARIGVELEWLVQHAHDPSLHVPPSLVRHILDTLRQPGTLPGAGLLTQEPGGQVELSSAPAASTADLVAAVSRDAAVLRDAFGQAGLVLTGSGIDPFRRPRRVLHLPRYTAMEQYFDRLGRWGRLMMCSTASVQVCVDAGLDSGGADGYAYRWRLLHAIGPVLVAAFANSPLRRGKPTGWKCTRQLVWARLDPGRTHAPPGAEPTALAAGHPSGRARPLGGGHPPGGAAPPGERNLLGDGNLLGDDPRAGWARYALDAGVLCLRRPDGEPWPVPPALTFRDWLRGRHEPRPTADDLAYHLSTLFPPVRPRGHLELRMIDAQHGDGWMVPLAVVAALADDPAAADAALAATEPVWQRPSSPRPRAASHVQGPAWLRAARHGLADPDLAQAARLCFEAADAALTRSAAPSQLRDAVADYADRYVQRGRCPADDILDPVAAKPGGIS